MFDRRNFVNKLDKDHVFPKRNRQHTGKCNVFVLLNRLSDLRVSLVITHKVRNTMCSKIGKQLENEIV